MPPAPLRALQHCKHREHREHGEQLQTVIAPMSRESPTMFPDYSARSQHGVRQGGLDCPRFTFASFALLGGPPRGLGQGLGAWAGLGAAVFLALVVARGDAVLCRAVPPPPPASGSGSSPSWRVGASRRGGPSPAQPRTELIRMHANCCAAQCSGAAPPSRTRPASRRLKAPRPGPGWRLSGMHYRVMAQPAASHHQDD